MEAKGPFVLHVSRPRFMRSAFQDFFFFQLSASCTVHGTPMNSANRPMNSNFKSEQ